MMINTGCRTDIPVYFSKWFYNRIKEGYVLVRNPYYKEQVLKYRLSPDVVDIICFCTKNPEPMIERLEELKQFSQFWFETITPYEKEIEPNVPNKNEVIKSFQKLSDKVGASAVHWRYDPIFITEKYSLKYHIEIFHKMAAKLSGYTNYCTISFIDLYEKTKRNFPYIKAVTKLEQEIIVREFVEIGRKYNIKIRLCCENKELERFGADASGCMTKDILESSVGFRLSVPKSKNTLRTQCNCMLGNDIGMYNTCAQGCIYCYANYDRKTVLNNIRLHNPKSPFLIGEEHLDEHIIDAKQEAYRDNQMSLFDLF